MNLGCLVDSSSRKAGGLFESVRRLAQSFPQQHGTTVVFSLEDEHTAEDARHWQPLAVRTFPAKFFPAWGYAPRLADALLDANLDVLLAHGIWKYSSAATLRWHRRTGRPHIINPHGMLDPWAVRNSPWKKRAAALLYENANLRSAACLRALCESEAQAMRAFGLRNPICVIPNGIDLPVLTEMTKDEWRMTNADSASTTPHSALRTPTPMADGCCCILADCIRRKISGRSSGRGRKCSATARRRVIGCWPSRAGTKAGTKANCAP